MPDPTPGDPTSTPNEEPRTGALFQVLVTGDRDPTAIYSCDPGSRIHGWPERRYATEFADRATEFPDRDSRQPAGGQARLGGQAIRLDRQALPPDLELPVHAPGDAGRAAPALRAGFPERCASTAETPERGWKGPENPAPVRPQLGNRNLPPRDRGYRSGTRPREIGSLARCAGDAGLKAPTGRTGRRSWLARKFRIRREAPDGPEGGREPPHQPHGALPSQAPPFRTACGGALGLLP